MITKPWKRPSFLGNALASLAMLVSVGLFIPILPRLLNTQREIPAYYESQYVELGQIESERLPALVEHEFLFRNTSSESVSVLEVNSSCSCTTYGIGSDALAPGETTSLHASMSLNQCGAKTATIVVKWSDRTESLLQMRAFAVVKCQYSVAPRYLYPKPGRITVDDDLNERFEFDLQIGHLATERMYLAPSPVRGPKPSLPNGDPSG